MRLVIAPLLLVTPLIGQTLHQEVADFAKDAQGTVSVGCVLPGVKLDCGLNAHGHPPMQSVFKFPLSIAVFQQIEAGRLSLDQTIRFLPSDRYPGSYSPLQDAHPNADVDVPLRELMRLSVSLSDNVATDILLRLIGGPATVQALMNRLGYPGIHVVDSERTLHDDETLQYHDFADPMQMAALLQRLVQGSPIDAGHTALLTHWMTETPSAPKRIKGLLPPGTVVAHKTGFSGAEKGMTAATNDVALITLPDGRHLSIAIFITDSTADDATRDTVSARIAKAIYDAAIAARP